MDVTCDRCKTRYEFDAALVSSRGTTVKCTNCSHQFRVFRPAGTGGLSGWTVRKADGSELRFLAMRELQSSIATGHIGETDVLVPDDGSKPQQLGAIEELRSFFKVSPPTEADTTRRQKRDEAAKGGTLASHQPAPPTARVPLPPPRSARVVEKPAIDDIDLLETNQALPKVDIGSFQQAESRPLGGTSFGFTAPSPPPAPKVRAVADKEDSTPDGIFQGADLDDDVRDALDRVSLVLSESAAPSDASASEIDDHETPASARPGAVSGREDTGTPSAPPSSSQSAPASADAAARPASRPGSNPGRLSTARRSSSGDPRFSEYGRRSSRPGFGRWTAGLIALGVAGLVGATALRKLGAESKPNAVAADDARVTKLVQDADKLLLDGDLDGAKELFAKASGAAENDPRAARGLAKVALLQADRAWLRARLEGNDPDDLGRLVERATASVAVAVKTSGDDAVAAALELDALRLQGKLADARKLVSRVNGSDPIAGRSLATLDLCEADPSWDTVMDRLKTAAVAEKKLGQSQALLVYALARRGDVDGAKRELGKLVDLDKGNPLNLPLKDYVSKAKPSSSASDAEAAPSASASGSAGPDEFRDALAKGRAAQKRGNYDEAEKQFKAALDKNAGNGEALLGLAEISRARGDALGAEKRYKEMLKSNPDFVPGLSGMADVKWQRGDRGGAVELYRQVILNAPNTAYADHAHQRIQEATGGGQPPAPKGGGKHGPKGGSKGDTRHDAPSPSNPEIDTTDLPP